MNQNVEVDETMRYPEDQFVVSKDKQNNGKKPRNACLNCRKRKTRCDFDMDFSACKRCRKEQLKCELPRADRRGGFSNVIAGRMRKYGNGMRKTNQSTSRVRKAKKVLPESDVFENEVYSASDAIDILKTASSQKPLARSTLAREDYPRLQDSLDSQYHTNSQKSKPVRRTAVENSAIVMDKILTPEDVTCMVEFFFVKIAPFYVTEAPWEYEDITRLASEPALLTVICTIGATCRKDQSFQSVHRKLWQYTQYTLTNLLWDCSDDQASSVIFAVTILCEHAPGALLYNEQFPGEIFKKHTRICWPLMGQAVRLAHYVGLSHCNARVNIALHFCDYLLAIRLGRMPMLDLMASSEEEFPREIVEQLPFFDRARLGLVKLLQLANNYLYRSRAEARHLVASGQSITALNLIHPLVEKWREEYAESLRGNSWAARTTYFEFSHVQLYIFSLAFSSWNSQDTKKLFMWRERYKFSSIAVEAAKSIITHESSSDIPVELAYSPIQWITRLLHASVFLVKTLLTGSLYSNVGEIEEVIGYIRTAARTMSELPTYNNQTFSKSLILIAEKLWTHFNPDKSEPLESISEIGGICPSSDLGFLQEPTFSELQNELNEENIWDLLFDEDLAIGMEDPVLPDS